MNEQDLVRYLPLLGFGCCKNASYCSVLLHPCRFHFTVLRGLLNLTAGSRVLSYFPFGWICFATATNEYYATDAFTITLLLSRTLLFGFGYVPCLLLLCLIVARLGSVLLGDVLPGSG